MANKLIRWIYGDSSTSPSLGSLESLVTGPLDMEIIDRDTMEITLENTGGTGSVKITAGLSNDGITEDAAIGDVISGITSGSTTLPLANPGGQYRYMLLTITETAAAATTARCDITGVQNA